jgi:hypothetical protein
MLQPMKSVISPTDWEMICKKAIGSRPLRSSPRIVPSKTVATFIQVPLVLSQKLKEEVSVPIQSVFIINPKMQAVSSKKN